MRSAQIDLADPPLWLVHLVRTAALMNEETECDELGHDAGDDCDACAWDALYRAVPQPVKAAAERAVQRASDVRTTTSRPNVSDVPGSSRPTVEDDDYCSSCNGPCRDESDWDDEDTPASAPYSEKTPEVGR